jgi:hypothetical protein
LLAVLNEIFLCWIGGDLASLCVWMCFRVVGLYALEISNPLAKQDIAVGCLFSKLIDWIHKLSNGL